MVVFWAKQTHKAVKQTAMAELVSDMKDVLQHMLQWMLFQSYRACAALLYRACIHLPCLVCKVYMHECIYYYSYI